MKIDNDAPMLDIVIPVYNEQEQLEKSVLTLREYLRNDFPYSWQITIVDNGSQDETWNIARRLEQTYRGEVQALHMDQKGRGRALRRAWGSSRAAVVCYMDVDLSTGLEGLLPLVSPLMTGHSMIAIGSRLARGAKVKRQWKREIISRCYNLLIKMIFGPVFSDAQCGFKAVRKDLLVQMLPEIENNEWFFDSEMLLLAAHNKIRIHEVPVDWVEDPDTRVNIKRTVMEDLKGLTRMRFKFWSGDGFLGPGIGELGPVVSKQRTVVSNQWAGLGKKAS
jgi:glycosyltransferase involved in cell wall biosynthesis